MSSSKHIPFGRPMIDDAEKEAVLKVMSGNVLVHGPVAKQFESDFSTFVGGGHSVSVSSCTAAMHMAYFAWGLGPGDEVLVPAQTHVATAHAVELTGAKPVFVDAGINTGNVDIDDLETKITAKTKAISIVHYLGMPVDMARIMAIAKQHQLKVVEDAALAIGTTFDGVHAGLHGDMGAFSFYPVKHMTTAEGGVFLTKDPVLAEQISRIKAFGVDRTVSERKIPGEYDVTMLGLNYRMNEIQAAIGIEQIKKLPSFLQARQRNYEALHNGLAQIDGITLFESTQGQFNSSYYCLSVLLDAPFDQSRTDIIQGLKSRGVGSSIYYPQSIPNLTYYRQKYGYDASACPVAQRISDTSIALPVGPHLSEQDMGIIVEQFSQTLQEVRG